MFNNEIMIMFYYIYSIIIKYLQVPYLNLNKYKLKQVEERLKFYEDGTKPRKNTEVMDDACAAYNKLVEEVKVEKKEIKQEVKVRGLFVILSQSC